MKVLIAVDEKKIMLDGFACVAIIDVHTAKQDAEKMVEELIKETEQRVLEDCRETLLGCDGKCKDCDATIPDIYCPYSERLELLREKYKGVE